MHLIAFAALALGLACTEEFKPPPKKEAPKVEVVAGPAGPITLSDLIGTDKRKFGFETTPILGATKEQVHKAYGSHMIGRTANGEIERLQFDGWMNIKGIPETGRNLLVTLVWSEGRVFSYELLVRDLLEEELIKALTAIRGAATGVLDRQIGVWFGDNPATTIYVIDYALRIVVRSKSIKPDEAKIAYRGRKTPAQIIGTASDRFAFEPVPLLGVSVDQLAALSPTTRTDDRGRMLGELTILGAFYLPTYYDGSSSVGVRFALDKKRAITQFEFAVPYHQGIVDAIVAARGPAKETVDETQTLEKGATFLAVTPNWIRVRVGGVPGTERWLSARH